MKATAKQCSSLKGNPRQKYNIFAACLIPPKPGNLMTPVSDIPKVLARSCKDLS